MIEQTEIVGSEPGLLGVAEAIVQDWDAVGTSGHFLALNLETGDELGFAVTTPVPLASVAKVPIALAALELIDRGELDPATCSDVDPRTASPGSTGSSLFRHPAQIALGDLVALALTVSDNAAADLILEVVPIERVTAALTSWGCDAILIRHPMRAMFDSATRAGSGSFELALELAIDGPHGGRAIEALDPGRANVGSARALVELLADVWQGRVATSGACAELRRLLSLQVFTQRIAADLQSDSISIAGKTGTFLNLRHDIAVVEDKDGERVAIAALTRTRRRATLAPDVDLAIAAAARLAFEALRG
jgi:beta-lactamase class A